MAKKELKYGDMDDGQLAEARAALDAQMAELRGTKKELAIFIEPTLTTKPTEEQVTQTRAKISDLETQLLDLRAKKKAIQDVVDSRIQPLGKADNTIGFGGIPSGEAVGNIGGN